MTKSIKILGTGCPKCKTLASLVNDVVSDNKIDATVEKVDDIMKIMEYDVMTTPALVIDGVISIKGRVPSKNEVLELLQSNNTKEDSTSNNCCCP